MIDRNQKLRTWLKALSYDVTTLETASEDASFRRYFRVKKEGESYIVMDAPPENESCDSFVALATSLTQHKINAPKIYAKNMEEGFLVLSDFGDDLLLGLLNKASVDGLYQQAMHVISQMQKNMPNDDIPEYSSKMLQTEMSLFNEWFVQKLLGLSFNPQQEKDWQKSKERLAANALEQPQVFVHRDYHSRNLLLTKNNTIGIIDFQDAVKGAMTYDLVSLLRDCYIAWPNEEVERWLKAFYELTKKTHLKHVPFEQFKTWFNLMGVQRHLKAIGIFSRLKIRDNKHGYIADIPRTLAYVIQVCEAEPSLNELALLIKELKLETKINSMLVH